MQPQRRRYRFMLGILSLGLLAGVALTAHPAQAQEVNGGEDLVVNEVSPSVSAVAPYYALPSWDQKIASATRFVVLTNWGSIAVLDKETGLVWQIRPVLFLLTWYDARGHCANTTVNGSRKGWRLPSIHELASLLDTSVAGRTLPLGHPFLFISNFSPYWTATSDAANLGRAWGVFFNGGSVFNAPKGGSSLAWCVRGGNNADAY